MFAQDEELLRAHGHEVLRFTRHNDSINRMNPFTLGINTVWSRNAAAELGSLVRRERPDVVHFHNTFPLISPAAYYSVRREGAAVVQTLHNYRLICPAATLLRAGSICEDCVGRRFPSPAVRHACYRGSRPASATLSAMLSVHHVLGTWHRKVDRFIALTEFAKRKFSEGGLPPARIAVKPNYCRSPDAREPPGLVRGGGLYVGRLSEEKGIDTLITAWQNLEVPLTVIGEGPLAARLQDVARVRAEGRSSSAEVAAAMQRASFLVLPSKWYEGFPLVIAEAFSQGLPVIASRLGALAELVEDGLTGLHVRAGDDGDLAQKVCWAAEHPGEMREMGDNARRAYMDKYTPEVNYPQLIAIYESALAQWGGY